jgi:hypothetical protein
MPKFDIVNFLPGVSTEQVVKTRNEWRQKKDLIAQKLIHIRSINESVCPVAPPQGEQTAWHYTVGERFLTIEESGRLLPTDACIQPHERPVLWFSRNQLWEPTSRKAAFDKNGKFKPLTKQETSELGCGLVRYGYPAARLIDWNELAKRANIFYSHVKLLEKRGREQGANPMDWMGSFSSIEVSELILESWDGKNWIRIRNRAQEEQHSQGVSFSAMMKEAA